VLGLALIDPGSASDLAHPVENAANSIIQTGVMGALLILAVAGAILAVWKLNRTNEARVRDQQAVTKTLIDVTTALRQTMEGLTGTTDALKEAVNKNTEQSRSSLASMERTVNETVRDAIRALRRFSPPGGTPRAGG
jgi:methylthioribose-1-phosphate isomerase